MTKKVEAIKLNFIFITEKQVLYNNYGVKYRGILQNEKHSRGIDVM